MGIGGEGGRKTKEKIPDAVSIFILPPEREKLEWRLRTRGLDSEEVIRRRLDTARREIENYSKYDYILVNDLLEQSADQLRDIVLAERLRRGGTELSGKEKHLVEAAQACRLDRARERVQPILASFNPQAGKTKVRSGLDKLARWIRRPSRGAPFWLRLIRRQSRT